MNNNLVGFVDLKNIEDFKLLSKKMFLIIWIKEAYGEIKYLKKSYDIEKNSLFFIHSNEDVDWVLTKKEINISVLYFHYNFYCIYTNGKDYGCDGTLFNNLYSDPYIQVNDELNSVLTLCMQNLSLEILMNKDYRVEICRAFLELILINSVAFKNSIIKSIDEKNSNDIFYKLRELIEENFKSEHGASFYANKLNINPKKIATHLKDEHNTSILKLVSQRLISESKKILYLSDSSIKDVAYTLGFNDPAHFSKVFKKHVGLSPEKYRSNFF